MVSCVASSPILYRYGTNAISIYSNETLLTHRFTDLNAVNTEGYRYDEFKAIHIIADAAVLPDMTAHTMLFQNAVLDYKTVSVLLGHANITTTLNLYVHPNMEQKKKCITKMFKSLGK